MGSDDHYRLESPGRAGGEPLLVQARAVARTQIDSAVRAVTDPGDDVAAAVHEARKCCKKLRGLARLIRPAIGDAYRPANQAFRDAARALGPLRDAHAVAVSFDELVAGDERVVLDLSTIGDELRRRSDAASASVTGDAPQLAAAADLLRAGAVIVESWPESRSESRPERRTSDVDGERAVLQAGVAGVVDRARRALAAAEVGADEEAWHDYRKRVKDTWYHLRLLEPSAPALLGPLVASFDELSDVLGDEHDLAVLAELLDELERGRGDHGISAKTMVDARFVIDGRREGLQRRARTIGTQLHAPTATTFAAFVTAAWADPQGR